MTISYSGHFHYLLFRWKGSLWKSVWRPFIAYVALYFAINLVIRLALDADQLETFKKIKEYCAKCQEKIPLLFLLGFYVSMIVNRWWVQFQAISWPDRFMISVVAVIDGDTDEDRLYRRTLARWCITMSVLCWREISSQIRRRFPTTKHLVECGLMHEAEYELYENTNCKYGKWWLPAIWASSLARKLQDEGTLHPAQAKILIKDVEMYRAGFGSLACYDWIPVPLVYTQVAIVATYGYFAFSLLAEQLFLNDEENFDSYIPILAFMQFIFYQGWLSVGGDFMSPFGEDDDDFEMNWILDRNLFIALLLADSSHAGLPDIEKDRFWEKSSPTLPHTKISSKIRANPFEGHLSGLALAPEDMLFVNNGTLNMGSNGDVNKGGLAKSQPEAIDRKELLDHSSSLSGLDEEDGISLTGDEAEETSKFKEWILDMIYRMASPR